MIMGRSRRTNKNGGAKWTGGTFIRIACGRSDSEPASAQAPMQHLAPMMANERTAPRFLRQWIEHAHYPPSHRPRQLQVVRIQPAFDHNPSR